MQRMQFASGAGLWELAPWLSSQPRGEVYWRPVQMAVAELRVSAGGAGAGEPQPEPECTLLHTAGPAVRLRSVSHRRGGTPRVDVTTRVDAFRDQPTCLDLRSATESELEQGTTALAVIGVHSGEVILLEPMKQRVVAMWNKGHLNAGGRCTAIAWAPHDPLQFAASFASGVVLLFDLSRSKEDKMAGGAREPKSKKHNPCQRWRLCKDPVFALKYGPPSVSETAGLLAVATGDGAIRVCDTATGLPTVTFTSYFGGVRCIDWSPDGKYLVVGGEDDNVVMWSLDERRQIARCVGHSSWISSVQFLPWPSVVAHMGSQDGVYTFASAGAQTAGRGPHHFVIHKRARLCIWEINTKVVGASKEDTAARPSTAEIAGDSCESGIVIAAAGERDRSVSRVVPVVDEASLHAKPLSALAVSTNHLFTGCDANNLKAWGRPAFAEPPPISAGAVETDDDGLVDVESDTGSDEREQEEVAGPIPAATRSEGVTADV